MVLSRAARQALWVSRHGGSFMVGQAWWVRHGGDRGPSPPTPFPLPPLLLLPSRQLCLRGLCMAASLWGPMHHMHGCVLPLPPPPRMT